MSDETTTLGGRAQRWLQRAVALPYVWLLLFFLTPFLIILKISVAEPLVAQPPFTPLFEWGQRGIEGIRLTFENYAFLFQDGYYGIIYLSSLKMAAIGTLLCLLIGYPMAYYIARQPARRRQVLLLAVILPFWISFLLRVYAWIGLLNNRGVINDVLLCLGVIDEPLTMLYNDFAVYLGIVYSYLPFMILPLYANLERLDIDLLDAAADLGARRWQAFVDVTLPLVGAGHRRWLPAGVHSRRRRVHDPGAPGWRRHADDRPCAVGRVLHQPRLAGRFSRVDHPGAAAGRADRLVPARRDPGAGGCAMRRRSLGLLGIVAFGYAFLYLPILSVMIYSFNDSRLVTLWGGFSLRWYAHLLEDEEVLEAALLSLRIAAVSATVATCLGALVALAMQRLTRLRGRLLLAGMITAPLVMPEIITGLSLLFLFISMAEWIGWPATRGATTITIAHITFSMAYVAVVVRSRLAGMDESLEEAAMDLGGRPLAVFFDITVPMLLPALVSGWLLAFTLSLDDLVISSFVSGPGATTLPMLIFAKVRLGVTPDINAIATIIIALVAVGVVTAALLTRRRDGAAAS